MATSTVWQVQVVQSCLWCDVCATSSRTTSDVYLVAEDDTVLVSVRHQGTDTRCVTCDPPKKVDG